MTIAIIALLPYLACFVGCWATLIFIWVDARKVLVEEEYRYPPFFYIFDFSVFLMFACPFFNTLIAYMLFVNYYAAVNAMVESSKKILGR